MNPLNPEQPADAAKPIFLNPDQYLTDFCNICGNPRSEFHAFFADKPNRCNRCQSLERHRIFKWAYDWFIRREFNLEGKEILACTPGEAEMKYLLWGAKKLLTFDIRPVDWFDLKMDIGDMRPIADASMDCFFAMAIFQHVRDDEQAIEEIYRVLRPGGWLFAQASNLMHGQTQPFGDVTRHYGEGDYRKYGVGTYRVYGANDFLRLIGRRFLVKTFHGFDPITGGTDFIACGIKE